MQIPFEIDYYSSKNAHSDRPNEDYMLADQQNGIFIICDGISRTCFENENYPDPSPAAMAARLVASNIHEQLCKTTPGAHGDWKSRLRSAIERANRKLAEFNLQSFSSFDLGANDRAGTSCLVAIFENGNICIAAIGNCSALVQSSNRIDRFCGFQNHKLLATYPLPHENQQLEKIRGHRNKKGDAYGYGELTGESAALDFIEFTAFAVDNTSTIYLYSSGAQNFFERGIPNQASFTLEELDQRIAKDANERGLALDDRTVIRLSSS